MRLTTDAPVGAVADDERARSSGWTGSARRTSGPLAKGIGVFEDLAEAPGAGVFSTGSARGAAIEPETVAAAIGVGEALFATRGERSCGGTIR